jgi:hypothetical protein
MGKQTTKRYGVDPHEDLKLLCCGCVPLRLAVFFIAIFYLVSSFIILFVKLTGLFDTAAILNSGYTIQSRTFLTFVEVSGAIWGFIGVQGAIRCHANSLTVFFYYQVIKLLCMILVFYYDLPALYSCEKWVTDMASQPEWNPQMYQVAMEGQCYTKRMLFYLVNFPMLLIGGYFTYINYIYVWGKGGLNEGLRERAYANIGDKATLGIFAASSLAEHTPLNVANQWPQEAPKKPLQKSITDDAKPWGALPSTNFGYPEDEGGPHKRHGDKTHADKTAKGDKGSGKGAKSPGTKGAADASADGPGVWSSLFSNPFGSKAPAAPPATGGHGGAAAGP